MQKFLCDAMLGSLAKWLRIMGYDTELAGKNEKDKELIKRAEIEKRVLLTKDKELNRKYEKSVLMKSEELEEQIKSLRIHIPKEPAPNYCSLCNGKLIKETNLLHKDIEKGWKCQDCEQQYWEGSHWKNMKTFLEKLNE